MPVAVVEEQVGQGPVDDDESSWGPAKALVAELAERGVDLTDREAIDDAIRQLNAEQLARRLIQE